MTNPWRSLDDNALRALVNRKRQARGADPLRARTSLPTHKQTRQWRANLELPIDGALSETNLRAQYIKLITQYHPAKHRDEPQKHRAAVRLASALTAAYEGLLQVKRR